MGHDHLNDAYACNVACMSAKAANVSLRFLLEKNFKRGCYSSVSALAALNVFSHGVLHGGRISGAHARREVHTALLRMHDKQVE